jgi:hypothetical protein
MRKRLTYDGGAAQQDRMIQGKLKSMLAATKHSYQAARFSEWPDYPAEFPGLFNPVTQTESFDTKLISVPFDSSFKPGTIFHWKNTDTHWIIFLRDWTELAYLRGQCRRCDHKVQWVDGDQTLQETLISVIGPTTPMMRQISSQATALSEDVPNANTKMLVPDGARNRAFFHRYQTMLFQGIAFRIEHIDFLSMPGVIQLYCTEDYSNLVEDDVEMGIRNAFNVLPIVPTHLTDYMIEGPSIVKPMFEAYFEAIVDGGTWSIIESQGVRHNEKPFPARIVERNHQAQSVHVLWDDLRRGAYTIAYTVADGTVYQRHVLVESLM